MTDEYSFWLPDEKGQFKEIKTKSNAVIFIGANGAGKSRLGAWIEQQKTNQVHRIGAQRNINFTDHIQLKSYSESEDLVMYGNADQNNRENKIFKYGLPTEDKYVTHMFDDFNNVLSAIISKTNNENDKFVRECKDAELTGRNHPHTPVTDIDKLYLIWKDIFPQRDLQYSDSKFYAIESQENTKAEYSATKMSDGERTALYFIAQVLCVPSNKVLLVDEPELHLHRSLMNRLWSALEKYRSDCLFIYITHDTQFAALHLNADKYWVKEYSGNNRWKIQKIEGQELPEDLLLDLLGNRKNVLFVEGEKGSFDTQLYSTIYKGYYIVPCGSCTQVIARTRAFNNTEMLHHYKAYGIIDRDYRSENEINAYREDNIFTIDVAEVENLFITEEIIREVSQLLGQDPDDAFIKVSSYVINDRFKKQINSQICQAVIAEIKYRLSIIDINKKEEVKIKESLDSQIRAISYDNIKAEIEKSFETIANSGDYRQVIRKFNEKGIARSIGHILSIQDKDYCNIVSSMLNKGTIQADKTIGFYMPSSNDIPR